MDKAKQIKIESIVVDWKVYPRNEVSTEHVGALTEAKRAGSKLPPILVEQGSMRLIDGLHRIRAHEALGLETISALLVPLKTDAEILAGALNANSAHGRPLDRYDIRKCINRLVELGVSVKSIGELARMRVETIELLRGQSFDSPAGRQPTKGGMHHLKGRTLSTSQAQAVEKYSGMQPTFHVNQLLLVLKNDLWDGASGFTTAMDELVDVWAKLREKVAS